MKEVGNKEEEEKKEKEEKKKNKDNNNNNKNKNNNKYNEKNKTTIATIMFNLIFTRHQTYKSAIENMISPLLKKEYRKYKKFNFQYIL